MISLEPNRVLARIDRVRAQLKTGLKADGTPITVDLVEFERGLDNTFEEHFRFQQLQAEAHARGLLTTSEAQTVYAALGEVGGTNGWSSSADLATKLVVTQLMEELLTRKIGARA